MDNLSNNTADSESVSLMTTKNSGLSRRMPETDDLFNNEPQFLQAVLNNLYEGVIVAGPDGRFLLFNPPAARILGMGWQDIPLQSWSEVYGCYALDTVTPIPSEDLPLARALNGESVENEVIFIRNAYQQAGVWISLSANPVYGEDGRITAGVVTLRDISASMQPGRIVQSQPIETAEPLADLQNKYRRLAMAVQQTADSVLITDQNGIIEYVNPGFEATTGYRRQEAIGKTPRILKSGQQDDAFYRNLWAQISAGEHFRGTLLNRKKDGTLYWTEQTITPLKDDAGHITNYVSVLKDITELKKKEQQDVELKIARRVQERFLPKPLALPGFDIAGRTQQAGETGGDYFDYLTANGALWLAVGDVCDHGIGSALVMAETRAYLRSIIKRVRDPGKALTALNRELIIDGNEEHFVTMILVRIDLKTRSLSYASAGHVPGYLLDSAGETRLWMRNTGIPLGIFDHTAYQASDTLPLNEGDLLALFSDGIIEAVDEAQVPYSIERALDVIAGCRSSQAAETVDELCQAIIDYSHGGTLQDDTTALVCHVTA